MRLLVMRPTYADRLVSSGPPPVPTHTMLKVGIAESGTDSRLSNLRLANSSLLFIQSPRKELSALLQVRVCFSWAFL